MPLFTYGGLGLVILVLVFFGLVYITGMNTDPALMTHMNTALSVHTKANKFGTRTNYGKMFKNQQACIDGINIFYSG